jgi:hypothetical protein
MQPPNSEDDSTLTPQSGQVNYDPWIERLAWLMDSSIGIGNWRIGIDPLLGLVPVLGDAAGAVISMLIVARSIRAGVPRVAAARMMVNVAVDSLVGSIPVGGDLFDFAFKANEKNVRIYKRVLAEGKHDNVRYWLFFACLGAGVVSLMALPVALIWLVFRSLH